MSVDAVRLDLWELLAGNSRSLIRCCSQETVTQCVLKLNLLLAPSQKTLPAAHVGNARRRLSDLLPLNALDFRWSPFVRETDMQTSAKKLL
jgi:hypothetical protein